MTDTRNVRVAAEEPDFPYSWPGLICYIHISDEGVVSKLHTRDDLRVFLSDPSGRLFAAWPGRYRTDLFLIDPAVMKNQMGLS